MVVFAKFNDRRGPLPREIRRRCSVEWSLEKPCPHPLGLIGQVGSTLEREAARLVSTPRRGATGSTVQWGPRGGRAASVSLIPAGWLSPITPHPPQCLGTACIGGRGGQCPDKQLPACEHVRFPMALIVHRCYNRQSHPRRQLLYIRITRFWYYIYTARYLITVMVLQQYHIRYNTIQHRYGSQRVY